MVSGNGGWPAWSDADDGDGECCEFGLSELHSHVRCNRWKWKK